MSLIRKCYFCQGYFQALFRDLLCKVASHLHLDLTVRYFNYRTTRFLAEEGFYKFHNWFDDRAWYPLGRIIGGTIYPGRIQKK